MMPTYSKRSSADTATTQPYPKTTMTYPQDKMDADRRRMMLRGGVGALALTALPAMYARAATGAELPLFTGDRATLWRDDVLSKAPTLLKPLLSTSSASVESVGAATPKARKTLMLEFFWLGCPHCFEMERRLEASKLEASGDLTVIRVPIMQGRWRSGGQLVQGLMVYAEKVSKTPSEAQALFHQLLTASFNDIHRDGHALLMSGLSGSDPSKDSDPAAQARQTLYTRELIGRQKALDLEATLRSPAVSQRMTEATALSTGLEMTSAPQFAIIGKRAISPAGFNVHIVSPAALQSYDKAMEHIEGMAGQH